MQNLAKIQRTKAIIAKIDQLLQEKWESFETTSVDIVDPTIVAYLANPSVADDEQNYWRLARFAEKMRYELPDRQSDILVSKSALMTRPYTFTGQALWARAEHSLPLRSRTRHRSPGTAKSTMGRTGASPGAECLYMIVSRIGIGDASAPELFAENDIGDVDNDGMPEILDGWGHPIRLVRWPAGYPSPWHPTDTHPALPESSRMTPTCDTRACKFAIEFRTRLITTRSNRSPR